MAKVTQTVNSYAIDSDGGATGSIKVDDGATFAGLIIDAGGLRVDSLAAVGLVTTNATGDVVSTVTTDGAIVIGSAATGFAEIAAGTPGNIVIDDGGTFATVAVTGDILLSVAGATTLQSQAITGQTAETSIDNADLVLIYDDTAGALRKMTRANFVAGVSGSPGGSNTQIQYNKLGAFGGDADFTTNGAGTVEIGAAAGGSLTMNNAQNASLVISTTGSIDAPDATITVLGTVGAGGAATINLGGANATLEVANLTVDGTLTYLDTTNLRIEDKLIDLNSTAAGAGVGANASSGLNILSNTPANTVTFQTLSDGGALSSSSGLDVATGKDYSVNGTSVLNATTLGSSVVTSSLTAVGTITTGVWQGTAVGVAYGGTGQTSYTNGQLLIGNTTGNTLAKATLTAGSGITITNGAGTIAIAASGGPGSKVTGAYSAGVGFNIDFAIPTGSRTNVAFRATIYLEDGTTANSAMVTDEGIVVRASGAPLLPDFLFLIVPGTDGDKVALGTGGANTLRFTVAAPAGSGNYVATVDYTED
jgi:hypothetical protein